jgi:hypothetical protein
MFKPSNSASIGQNINKEQIAPPALVGPSPPNAGAGVGINYDPKSPVFAARDAGPPSQRQFKGRDIGDPIATSVLGEQGAIDDQPDQPDQLPDINQTADPMDVLQNMSTGQPTSAEDINNALGIPGEPGINQTSFRDVVADVYGEDSPEVKAARQRAMEQYGGSGLLFSDIAARGGEAAAMDKAMELAAPEVEYARQKESTLQSQGFQSGETQKAREFAGSEAQKARQFQREETRQGQKYETGTIQRAQEFQRDMTQKAQEFQKEITSMGFSHDMEAALLNTVQNMMNTGIGSMTSLAMSPDATTKEVDKIRESLMNQLTTFTNIWKGSAGSEDTFDFSGIA